MNSLVRAYPTAQRLANGNTLICEGDCGRIFEVTSDGELVWEFVNPYFCRSARWGKQSGVPRLSI